MGALFDTLRWVLRWFHDSPNIPLVEPNTETGADMETSVNRTLNFLKATRAKQMVIADPGGNGDYTTIAEAVASGATYIYLRAGTYTLSEDLTLEEQILIGESAQSVTINMTNQTIIMKAAAAISAAGTIALTAYSTTITGTATDFTNVQSLSDLWLFVDGFFSKVTSVTNDTTATLTHPYRGKAVSGAGFLLFSAENHGSGIANVTLNHAPTIADKCIEMSGVGCAVWGVEIYGDHTYTEAAILASNDVHNAAVRCSIENSRIFNCKSQVVFSLRCGGCVIKDSSFMNPTLDAILNSGNSCLITNCSISGAGGNGIFETSSAIHNRYSNNQISNVNAIGISLGGVYAACESNTIKNTGTMGISASGSKGSVVGNVIEDPGTNGIDITGVNWAITGNTVVDAGAIGIDVNSSAHETSINSNTVLNSTGDSITVEASRCSITGNTINDSGDDGILVNGDDNLVSSNTVNTSADDGIIVGGDRNVISSNNLQYNTDYGLNVEATADRTNVGVNIILNNTDPEEQFHDGGTNTLITGGNIIA